MTHFTVASRYPLDIACAVSPYKKPVPLCPALPFPPPSPRGSIWYPLPSKPPMWDLSMVCLCGIYRLDHDSPSLCTVILPSEHHRPSHRQCHLLALFGCRWWSKSSGCDSFFTQLGQLHCYRDLFQAFLASYPVTVMTALALSPRQWRSEITSWTFSWRGHCGRGGKKSFSAISALY